MSRNVPKPAKPPVPVARYIYIFWGIIASSFLGFVLFLLLVGAGAFGALPSFEDLENPKNALATEIYTSDGKVLGKYYIQNRSYTRYDELSPYLIKALVATEDVRFYRHSGIDAQGIASIFAYKLMGKNRGASTISQQLAKNLFPRSGGRSIFRLAIVKMKEWITAAKIEKRYTKPEIIALYFNTVEFGYNAFGIKSASKTYFSKLPKDLSVDEAALLVGMLKGIEVYNPRHNEVSAINRRNTVLELMQKNAGLPLEEERIAKNKPLGLRFSPDTHSTGMATYFREILRHDMNLWCAAHKKPDGTPYNLYKDGLHVYTTLDSTMQAYGEQAVAEHMAKLQHQFDEHWGKKAPWEKHPEVISNAVRKSERWQQYEDKGLSETDIVAEFDRKRKLTLFRWGAKGKGMIPFDTTISFLDSIRYAKRFLHTGFMAMDPATGQIRAWVGGIDYRFSKYDHVNVNSKRQVGSTFKPLVYTVAIENGEHPCERIPNEPVTFEDFNNWTPHNYDGKNGGYLTLFQGLAGSVNNIVANLMKRVGPKAVVEKARLLGITSPLQPYPSLCLGSFDMSVYEITGAYAAFGNGGVWRRPQYITRITDKNGNVLEEFAPQSSEAIDEETNYVMTRLMQGVVRHGTARRLSMYTSAPVAGKTGTTQNNSDGWFMGVTPQLVAGAWVGAEDRSVHFRSTHLGGGANAALPIFGLFMKKVQANHALGIKFTDFEPPKNKPMTINLDCTQYRESITDTIGGTDGDAPVPLDE